MTYREHSYDPNAYEQPGKPLRPFNWVQWTGVAFEVAGVLLLLLFLAGQFGWMPRLIDTAAPFVFLPVIGLSLINSRREPGTLVGPEQRARNLKVLIVTTLICAAILAAAVTMEWLR